jgi:hypothetical protein
MSWPARATTTAAPAAGALRRQNHLQHLVRVFKEFPEFVALRSQRFRRQLRRHLDSSHGGIFRHVADFVHLDAGIAPHRRFQLLGQRGGLRVSAGKRAHEARELWLGYGR